MPTQPPRVLIIDDEVGVGRVLQVALSDCDVTVVHDGRDAAAALGDRPWEAVLCDVSLPHKDGPTLFAEATLAQRKRFVFMTGGPTREDDERFLAACGAPIIFKPFSLATVRRAVRTLSAS